MQLDLFPTTVHMRCIDPSRNKWRYYGMSVQRNLFGEWELSREWGRIGHTSRLRRDVFASPGRALDSMRDLVTRKSRRGYAA
ncbi:MAG: WGR domain-containing protein [Hyphomicrobiales bacterium]